MFDRRYKALLRETREFNREILLRNERVYTAMIAAMEANTEQTRANTKQVQENTGQLREDTEQVRANTRAVLSMLDRIERRDQD